MYREGITRRQALVSDGHDLFDLHTYWRSNGFTKRFCTYCEKRVQNWATSNGDHVVPMSRGGYDLVENIVPCCRSCNSSKGNRLLMDEWVPVSARDAAARKEREYFWALAANFAEPNEIVYPRIREESK